VILAGLCCCSNVFCMQTHIFCTQFGFLRYTPCAQASILCSISYQWHFAFVSVSRRIIKVSYPALVGKSSYMSVTCPGITRCWQRRAVVTTRLWCLHSGHVWHASSFPGPGVRSTSTAGSATALLQRWGEQRVSARGLAHQVSLAMWCL